jgi:hypothetical protein
MSEVPEGIGELRGHCWRGRSDKACRRQGRCLGNRMREFRDGGATGAISQNAVSGSLRPPKSPDIEEVML